jgi:hypothetical protein
MNLRTFLIAGASVVFGICLALVVINTVSAQAAPEVAGEAGLVGRYKLEDMHGLYLYDTTTGDCWWRDQESEVWRSLGNPRDPAAKK